ncbi:bifunctional diguanylate cyclase/phosphodiesterase [Lysinibacillus sp. 54212]|uniref:bifunctional diguanylate cyclase/phosphodiesterase n=1 Tax=Lysinibacillus sp. 54212 TaxID=3119829 RepID=UPI002FC60847
MHFNGIVPDEFQQLLGDYDINLVILSIAFACIASYTALALNERSKNNSFLSRYFWFSLSSVAMGFGIWSMHYMGMFSYSLPVEIHYNLILTILSIFPAMLASFIAFYIINSVRLTLKSAALMSVLTGLGVFGMHMIGMASMRLDALYVHNHAGLLLSILSSSVGFFILSSFHKYLHKIYTRFALALVIGLSVSATHYIAMLSVTFYVPFSTRINDYTIPLENRYVWAISLTTVLLLIVFFLMCWSIIDRYIETKSRSLDTLTKLPNSVQFEDNIKKKDYSQIAIWHIEDLSKINRTYGYHIGDHYIQQISTILKNGQARDELYRIDNNRFVFLSSQLGSLFELRMKSIATSLERPIEMKNEWHVPAAVCALAKASETKDGKELFKRAKAILRSSSIDYDRKIIIYNPSEHSTSIEEELLVDIQRAMEDNELFLVYQPKISSRENRLVGVEALLRWEHPKHGFLSPAIFIPILERNGLMGPVTDWIIEQVCKQIAKWKDTRFAFHQVSVNIPGSYVTSPQLLFMLNSLVEKYSICPKQLELEITETSFVKNLEQAMRAVGEFREKGYSVALDDFGTGLSSLSYLRQMSINTLKIDKAFIDEVVHSEKDEAILRAIISLGQSLHLRIVVEGVETVEQVNLINQLCEHPIIQGYYFAKPMRVAELEQHYSLEKVR